MKWRQWNWRKWKGVVISGWKAAKRRRRRKIRKWSNVMKESSSVPAWNWNGSVKSIENQLAKISESIEKKIIEAYQWRKQSSNDNNRKSGIEIGENRNMYRAAGINQSQRRGENWRRAKKLKNEQRWPGENSGWRSSKVKNGGEMAVAKICQLKTGGMKTFWRNWRKLKAIVKKKRKKTSVSRKTRQSVMKSQWRKSMKRQKYQPEKHQAKLAKISALAIMKMAMAKAAMPSMKAANEMKNGVKRKRRKWSENHYSAKKIEESNDENWQS